GTSGYCWSVSLGTIDNSSCGGIIVEMAQPSKSQTLTSNMQQPPGGGGNCNQPSGVTVNFGNFSSLTTVTVSVQDNCINSASQRVTVVPPLGSVSASPSTQTVSCTAASITCSSPTKGDGTYAYQWQSSSDNMNWVSITGATSSSYTPSGFST